MIPSTANNDNDRCWWYQKTRTSSSLFESTFGRRTYCFIESYAPFVECDKCPGHSSQVEEHITSEWAICEGKRLRERNCSNNNRGNKHTSTLYRSSFEINIKLFITKLKVFIFIWAKYVIVSSSIACSQSRTVVTHLFQFVYKKFKFPTPLLVCVVYKTLQSEKQSWIGLWNKARYNLLLRNLQHSRLC